MSHVALSVLCFILWVFALNLTVLGGILALKRMRGSASLFIAGMACLVALFALGICAHMDIAQSFRYVGMTAPLSALFLARRTGRKSDVTAAEAEQKVT